MSDFNKEKFFSEFDYPTYEEWKNEVLAALKGAPFEKKMISQSYEDIEIKPIYTKEDFEKVKHINSQAPGFYPYVRGSKLTGYLEQKWEVCQELPYCLPHLLNSAIKDEFNKGTDAFTIDVNTHKCKSCDCSHYKTSISDIYDLDSAFKGINIADKSFYFSAGISTPQFAVAYSAYCNKIGIKTDSLNGGFDFDPIGDLVQAGKLPLTKDELAKYISSYFAWVKEEFPNMKAFSINGNAYHRGGANGVSETAYCIATAVEYINILLDAGFEIDEICSKIKFKFAIGNNFFMHISKLRSARMVYARVIKEYGGNEDSQKMFIHSFTSKRQSSKYDPYVNLLRNTSRTFSAIAGNSDVIELCHFDYQYGMPSDISRRITRNIQNVLKEEAHLTDTTDPAGGSWYIEVFTEQFAEKLWNTFKNIMAEGGILPALEKEIPQKDIAKTSVQRFKNLEMKKDVYLGTNKYPNLSEKINSQPITVSEDEHREYADLLKNRIEKRKTNEINDILSQIRTDKDYELAIEAALKGATIAELFNAFCYNENGMTIEPIQERREIRIFEELRSATNKFKETNGEFPKVDLICFGPLKVYKGRADFSSDFFQVGGFECPISDGFSTAEEALAKVETLDSKVMVICSTDEVYESVIPQFASEMKKKRPDIKLVLAGMPEGKTDDYKQAGIDIFIHVRANVYEINRDIHTFYGLS